MEEPGTTGPLAGLGGPLEAAETMAGGLAAHPAVLVGALVVGLAAATARHALAAGPWGLAVWGSAYLGGIVLLPLAAGAPQVRALVLALGVWAAAAALAFVRVRQGKHESPASGTMAR